MADKQGGVLLRFAQPSNEDGENIPPVVKIGGEFPLNDHAIEIALGSRDQAGIGAEGPRTPPALELSLRQNAQQFGLKFERDLANLVQKDGAAVRPLVRIGCPHGQIGCLLEPIPGAVPTRQKPVQITG